jgi:hypothetical protein
VSAIAVWPWPHRVRRACSRCPPRLPPLPPKGQEKESRRWCLGCEATCMCVHARPYAFTVGVWRPVKPEVPSRRRTCPASPHTLYGSAAASLSSGITRGHKPSSSLPLRGSATVTGTRDPTPIRLVTRNRRRGGDDRNTTARSTTLQATRTLSLQSIPEGDEGAREARRAGAYAGSRSGSSGRGCRIG